MPDPIVVIGGGVMGSALAYWLTRLEPTRAVTVLERDPGYLQASSSLSAASISVGDDRPDIALREHGYLYLSGASGAAHLRATHAVQKGCGSDVELLQPVELAQRYSWLNTSDLSLGSVGLSGEGWFDGYSLLTAFGRKAKAQGASFVHATVSGLATVDDGGRKRISAVILADGSRVACSHVVNAAGPWARSVAAMAGVELSVHARRRTVYVIGCPTPLTPFPLLIDPTGFWIRPEGTKFIAGLSPVGDADDLPLEADYAAFESELWPALAHRIPAFEAAKLEHAWAGYFEMNTFDHNALLGGHESIENMSFMNGFSGHGMQQSPIVGRAVAELILEGRFTTLDLSELLFSRVAANRPLCETNVIG